MSDDQITAAHLDDETLSGLLDGDEETLARPGAAAHLSGCASCRARSDELAGAARAASIPVPTLPDEQRDDLVARALAAATASQPTSAGEDRQTADLVPLRPSPATRPRPWYAQPRGAVAALLVLVALAAGSLLADRAFTRSTASSASRASAPAPETSSTGGAAAAGDGALIQFRVVLTPAPAVCSASAYPPANETIALPDVIDTAGRKASCARLAPALAWVSPPATARITGPPGLSGDDTLTITIPGSAGVQFPGLVDTVKAAGTAARQRTVAAVADGAVIGRVASAISGPRGEIVVVVKSVSPAVAEYLEARLTNG